MRWLLIIFLLLPSVAIADAPIYESDMDFYWSQWTLEPNVERGAIMTIESSNTLSFSDSWGVTILSITMHPPKIEVGEGVEVDDASRRFFNILRQLMEED